MKISFKVLIFIVAVHLACIPAFFIFNRPAILLCAVLYWATACLGITLGYHRLLTHRSFKVYKPLEYFFALLGCLACQGGPIKWVAEHRLHHLCSDEEGDPHSPVKSFFWGHMGWLFFINPHIDQPKEYYRFAPDLAKDPVYVFLDKTYFVWTVLLAMGLYVWGGWTFVVWGIAVRTVLVYHATWLVNSAAHVWGYQTYKTRDKATNLWWVALLTWGEGWHNNHHAFQYSAQHGLRKREIDITFMVIRFLSFIGLADNIKLPTPAAMQRKNESGKKYLLAPDNGENSVDVKLSFQPDRAKDFIPADFEVPVWFREQIITEVKENG